MFFLEHSVDHIKTHETYCC